MSNTKQIQAAMNDHSLKAEIIKEIKAVYPSLPDEFYGSSLLTHVQFQIRVKHDRFPYEQTILRYFQRLRETGEIKCECTNRKLSTYKKIS